MAGLAGVLWVNEKQLPEYPYDRIARNGESRRGTDSEEFLMLHDRL